MDESACTGFEESIGMQNPSRVHELDLSDIVLKSEYDHDQHEGTASASYTEKTTTIHQEDDHQRVSVKNHHYMRSITPQRSNAKQNHSAVQ